MNSDETSSSAFGGVGVRRSQLGVVIYALASHQRLQWAAKKSQSPLCLTFLEQCHRVGAGGIQYPFTPKEADLVPELHRRADRYGMFVEAIVNLPSDDSGLDDFEAQLRLAKEAGASVARTVMLPGRRYEQFTSYAEFKDSEQRGLERLRRVEPIVAKHRFHLAVENHKDQLVAEKLETLRRLDSEYIGLCVDVGNNFPLLEDPVETVRAFAPWAFTVHLKDQAVRPSADGFHMADVALGEGCLDLPAIVSILRTAKPRIRFNYETITRDALSVPVLATGFWATLPDTPASDLARLLTILQNSSHPEAFATVSKMPPEQQLSLELENLETSLAYAREHLGL
jgi:3-oxoisoapionate decarboxylase